MHVLCFMRLTKTKVASPLRFCLGDFSDESRRISSPGAALVEQLLKPDVLLLDVRTVDEWPREITVDCHCERRDIVFRCF